MKLASGFKSDCYAVQLFSKIIADWTTSTRKKEVFYFYLILERCTYEALD